MTKQILILLLTAAIQMNVFAAPSRNENQVPKSFLKTDFGPAQRLLALKVSGDFKDATISEAIEYIIKKTGDVDVGSKFNVDWESLGTSPPRFSRNFDKVPLRTFFYLLSQDTGWTIKWSYKDKRPHSITFQTP